MHDSQPPGEEDQARKRAFAARADQFIERVRQARLTADTEIDLVYHCVDGEGNPLPPFRDSLVATIRVGAAPGKGWAKHFAAEMHLDAILGNIDSLVRNAPMGFCAWPAAGGFVGRVQDFELEIRQPSA